MGFWMEWNSEWFQPNYIGKVRNCTEKWSMLKICLAQLEGEALHKQDALG